MILSPRTLLRSVALAALLLPAAALALSGVQITPDGKRTLISKDVGTERWAITWNADDSSVTGNVFLPGGGETSFVWCEETSRADGEVSYRCFGADQCPLGPCTAEDWGLLAEVSLPEEFFLPPLEFPSAPGDAAQAIRIERVQGGSGGVSSPSGAQSSPDGKRRLVSKDVGGERWAITLHDDDLSVTGNVFFPGGGDPQFVWCEKKGFDDGTITFSCHGADRCAVAPCGRDSWTPLVDVPLPESFFSSPELVDADAAAAAGVAALGDDAAFVAILLATDRGYSNSQILRALLGRTLGSDGRIATKSGAVATPAGPPVGFFAATTSTATGSTQGGTPTPQQICDLIGEDVGPDEKTKLLIRLRDRGFTLDQIRRLSQGQLDVVDCNTAASVQAFEDCIEQYGRSLSLVRPTGDTEGPGEDTNESTEPEGFDPCGNGIRDDGEDCDGVSLNSQTCVTRGFVGGRLRCDEVCDFDTSECRSESTCGDSKADSNEVCDGTDVKLQTCLTVSDAFVGGELRCNSGCQRFDTTRCLEQSSCGNDKVEIVNGEKLEQCDGTDLGGGRCEDIQGKVAGLLRCRENCTYDDRDCRDRFTTDCGNDRAEGEEHCDRFDLRGHGCMSAAALLERSELAGGELGCTTECKFDFGRCVTNSTCPNGVREGREQCDENDFDGATCMSVGETHPDGPFVSGPLGCDSNCVITVADCVRANQCGNGKKDRFEDCDREDFGESTCEIVFNRPGRLLCTPNCGFDPQSCQRLQTCGDDFIEGTEKCDGFNLGDEDCAGLGLGGGELRCGADCQFDTTRCFGAPECGNRVKEEGEECDEEALDGATCENLGFDRGDLRCATNCKFDTSMCADGPECGDGRREGQEDCDEEDLGNITCLDLDFEGGDLACTATCKYDAQGCTDIAPCEEQLCPDGTCIPVGGDCCGGGNWCDPGSFCVGDNLCCGSSNAVECGGRFCMDPGGDCCGSLGWCRAGLVCAGSGCCPEATPKSCGDGTCTTADRVCCGGGGSCPGGTVCLPGEGCSAP